MSRDPDWTSWQVLDAALDTGSIAAAARRLGLSHATVRNRIETLEHALRATLFLRTNNGLQPTDEALALARPLLLMRSTSEGLLRAAGGKPGTVGGTVRVSTSEFVGAVVLPTMLGRLRKRHPDLSIALVPDNASLDLNMREADVALRMHRPAGDGLVATKVGSVPLGFYAAHSYVERRGMPFRAEDLPDHDLIGPDRAEYDRTVAEAFLPALAQANYVLRTDNHAAVLTAVRAGLGIGVLQRPVADADPALQAVLPDRDVERIETFVTAHRDLRGVPSIDAVFRWLVEEFRRYLRGSAASG